jgi:hypothetical protein
VIGRGLLDVGQHSRDSCEAPSCVLWVDCERLSNSVPLAAVDASLLCATFPDGVRTQAMRRFVFHLLPILSLATAVAPPATASGRILARWLEAFNSGDRAKLSAYAEQHHPNTAAQLDGLLQLR